MDVLKILSVVAFAGLGSCRGAETPVSPFCGMYDRDKLKTVPADMEVVAKAEDCAHHSAAPLAAGPDSADVIASGVLDICASEVGAWAAQEVQKDPSASHDQVDNSIKYEIVRQARIEVLRDRAGHCTAGP